MNNSNKPVHTHDTPAIIESWAKKLSMSSNEQILAAFQVEDEDENPYPDTEDEIDD